MGGHKGATQYPTIALQGQFGEERVLVCIIHCYVMIGTSPTSYLYQIYFIHIKGVCHALYAVGGYKDAAPYHTITLEGVGNVVGF